MGLWESKNHTTWISLGLQLLTWRKFSKVLAMKQKPESPPWLPPGYSGLVAINKGLGHGFFIMQQMMCRQTWGLGACFLWWSWLRVETPDVLKVTPKPPIKSCAVRKSKKSTEMQAMQPLFLHHFGWCLFPFFAKPWQFALGILSTTRRCTPVVFAVHESKPSIPSIRYFMMLNAESTWVDSIFTISVLDASGNVT